jgi:type I restriction-modification system DNA methylase subunit
MKDITFEDKLWKAADKLRKKVEVHEYKYIVLSLIFLRYTSGEKLPPYLRLPEKAIAYSIAIKVGK